MQPQPDTAAVAAFALGLGLIVFGAIVVSVLITVIPFWKICSKAGFSGALALLMLVPIANIILPFYIAFAEWPALKAQARPTQ